MEGGGRSQGFPEDGPYGPVPDGPGPVGGGDILEPPETPGEEPAAPPGGGPPTNTELAGDPDVLPAPGREEHDGRPLRGGTVPTLAPEQTCPLLRAQGDRRCYPHSGRQPCPG